MKKLLTAMAMVGVATIALADMPKFDVSGEIRVRWEEKNNENDFLDTDANGLNDDKVSRVRTGVRIGLDAELSDGIGAHISLQHGDGGWGELGRTGKGGNENIWNSNTENTGQNLLDNTWIRHAYFTIDDIGGILDLSVGRQAWGKQDHELVLFVDELDAKVAKAELGNLSLTGFCGKVNETGENADTDTDIQGLTASLDFPLGADLVAYGFRQILRRSNPDNADKNNVVGVKVSGSMDVASTIKYLVEYAKQTGSNTVAGGGTGQDRDANALRVCVGYETDVEGLGVLSIEGSYLKASGDDENTADKNERFTGIAPNLDYYNKLVEEGGSSPFENDLLDGANGIKVINLNATLAPEAMENLNLGISYTTFTSDQKNANGNDDLGSELDISIEYIYSDAATITFVYARFTPGDVQDDAIGAEVNNDDNATMLRCQILTRF
jgi:hypothetical protein